MTDKEFLDLFVDYSIDNETVLDDIMSPYSGKLKGFVEYCISEHEKDKAEKQENADVPFVEEDIYTAMIIKRKNTNIA